MNLVIDGVLTRDLYHGTSSISLGSIAEHGLGGRNPVEDLDLLPFVKALRGIAQVTILRSLSDEECWPMEIIDRITEGASSHLNWRYGQTYLTASRAQARSYARPEGSEIVFAAKWLYERIKHHDQEAVRELGAKYSSALSRLTLTGDPVVIKASSVPITQLRSETGGDAIPVIELLGQLLDENCADEDHDKVCAISFELAGALDPTTLRWQKLVDNDPKSWTRFKK
jgi:hypothetical protein